MFLDRTFFSEKIISSGNFFTAIQGEKELKYKYLKIKVIRN
jgi:hypothetical protein